MWRFDWSVFWAISPVVVLILYLSKQIEVLNRCLLDIETALKEIETSALFRDAEARKEQARLDRSFHELSAKESSVPVPYPVESMLESEMDILPVRPPDGMGEIRQELTRIATILETLRSNREI